MGVEDAALARLARSARVSVLAAERRPSLAPHLGRSLAAAERHAALLALVTDQLAATVGPLAEATCLLKGSAAIALVYARPAERERRDLDLLVDPAAFPALRAALWNTGWRDDPNRDAPGPPFSGRTLAMRRRFGAVTVSLDLHRDLVDRPWCGLLGDAFRRRFLTGAVRERAPSGLAAPAPAAPSGLAAPAPAAPSGLAAPAPAATLPVSSPVDTFLHTIAHLAAAGFPPTLAPWVDLTRLAPLCPAEALAEAAAAYRLRSAAWLALTTLSRWFGCETGEARAALALTRTRAAVLTRAFRGDGGTPASHAMAEARAVHVARALLAD
jgi:hypothetical protein